MLISIMPFQAYLLHIYLLGDDKQMTLQITFFLSKLLFQPNSNTIFLVVEICFHIFYMLFKELHTALLFKISVFITKSHTNCLF